MDIPTVPGSLYTVATKTTCDITDTATGTPIDSVSSGSVTFTAQGAVTTLSDPAATYSKVNFKTAAAALRLLGGGEQLPNGYLAAEFLESTGTQYIDTGFFSRDFLDSVIAANMALTSGSPQGYCGVYRSGGFSLQFWVTTNPTRAGGVFFSTVALNKPLENIYSFTSLELEENSVKVNGVRIEQDMPMSSVSAINSYSDKFFLFARNNTGYPRTEMFKMRMKYFKSSKSGKSQSAFVPAISANGQACMYDTVSKQSFLNSGTGDFIVGLTLAQARKLGKLPDGGGTLKISLPENYTDDAAVVAALSTATEKGWILETQTYTTAEASASTFALRRIWVKKIADPAGAYVDATGSRWHVEWCQTVFGAEPTDLGYEPFRSVDVALAEWELTPYIYPEEKPSSI